MTLCINTLEDPCNIGISLSNNRFTIPTGLYHIHITAPAFDADAHKAKLVKDPGGTPSDALIGTSGESSENTSTSIIEGIVSLASSTTYEVQHRGSNPNLTGFGLPSNFGVDEVYTQVRITQLTP